MFNNSNNIRISFLVICVSIVTLSSSYSFAQCFYEDTRKLNQDALKTCAMEGYSALSGLNQNSVANCLVNKYTVGQSCSNCLGEVAVCTYNECTGYYKPCGFLGSSSGSEECKQCANDKCGANFQQCANISLPAFRLMMEQ